MDAHYFDLRSVSPEDFQTYTVPLFLKANLPKEATILDFGCGYGQLLIGLRKEGYSQLVGLDILDKQIALCRQQGFQVFESIEDLIAQGLKFDRIVMSHVLEHIEKPAIISTLVRIRTELLSPKGKLILIVPNAMSNTGCYWMYEDWTHHVLFTPGSLIYVLKAAGFTQIDFIDPDCTAYSSPINRFIKKGFLTLYRLNHMFWNKITNSAYHRPSPQIFSFELKAAAYSNEPK